MLFSGWLINQLVSNETNKRTNEWTDKWTKKFNVFIHVSFCMISWSLRMPFKPPKLQECVRVFFLHQKFNDIDSFINLFIRSLISYMLTAFRLSKFSLLLFPCYEQLTQLDFNWFTIRKINIETKYTHSKGGDQFEQIQLTIQSNKRVHFSFSLAV